jgi:hypothetical protein
MTLPFSMPSGRHISSSIWRPAPTSIIQPRRGSLARGARHWASVDPHKPRVRRLRRKHPDPAPRQSAARARHLLCIAPHQFGHGFSGSAGLRSDERALRLYVHRSR